MASSSVKLVATKVNSSSSSNEMRSSKIKLRFVRPKNGKITAEMEQAFQMCSSSDNENKPEWISEEKTMKVIDQDVDGIVFVCQTFLGAVFKRLESKGIRVIGPRCLITCYEDGVRLPKTANPLFTMTMRGLFVCCTSVEHNLRLDIHKKVGLMGGSVARELTEQVTHLVCGEVGSKKYHVACSLNKSVMCSEWVEQCWNKGSQRSVHATDKEFDAFCCPVFYGLNITASNVISDQRKELQYLIDTNGGTYSGELRLNVTTHLVLDVPGGRKYDAANRGAIPCLKLAWIYDSVESGYCRNSDHYRLEDDGCVVKSGQGSSTPVKGQQDVTLPNISCLSSINATINETVVSNTSRRIDFGLDNDFTMDFWFKELDALCLSEAGPFLDGCRILLSGFPPLKMDKVIKILNSGAATRFRQLTDSVSHVVIGGAIEAEHKRVLEADRLTPYVVHFGWIIESLRLRRPADEVEFVLKDLYATKLQFDTEFPEPSTSNANSSSNVTEANNNPENRSESEMADVMTQYLNTETLAEFEVKIFERKTFCAFGFEHYDLNDIKEMVEKNGGTFLSGHSKVIVDYAIVPIPACEIEVKAHHIATHYWLQQCVLKGALFDVDSHPLFGVFKIDVDSKPLANCVLSFSKYVGPEKDCAMQIARLLGAMCQESFSREKYPRTGLLQNTHLIAPDPEGKKFDAAVKWGIPVVTMLWIVNCAIKNKRLNESDYSVKIQKPVLASDSDVPSAVTSNKRTISLSTNSSNSPETTLKRQLLPTSPRSPDVTSRRLLTLHSEGTPVNVNAKMSWRTPNSSVFKTPPSSQPPSTVERLKKIGDGLRAKYDFPLLQNNRVKELINKEADVSNESLNSSCDSLPSFDTPSKFMNPDVKFQPKLDVRSVMAYLESPCTDKLKEESPTSRLSLEDLYNLRIHQALRNEIKKTGGIVPHPSLDESIDENEFIAKGPLSGVVLTVSKRLADDQRELNGIAEKLGATCKWLYDKSCTHFVHTGRLKERCKELRVAMADNKFIVSPEWLRACEKNNARIDEESYPYDYNPNMALDIVVQRSVTLRSQRKAIESLTQSDSNSPQKAMNERKMKESANLKMYEIMAATDVARDKRVNRIQSNVSSSSNGSPSFSPFADSNSASRSLKSAKKAVAPPTESESEHLDSVPITWDDPNSRMERAKCFAQLKTDSQPRDLEFGDSREPDVSLSSASLREEPLRSHVFMFTKLDTEERQEAIKIIESRGGRTIDSQNFDMQCTHLLTKSPNRSEKFLAGLAAGIWILHVSYLDACQGEQRFVEEEKYEFAEDKLELNLSADGSKLAKSARYWRSKGQHTKGIDESHTLGAFLDWRVIIYSNESRAASFARLLEAGGATVLSTEPPFTNVRGATHAFIDMAHIDKPNIDLSALMAANVLCLKPEYICSYLLDWTKVSAGNFYIPEVLPLLKSSSVKCDDSIVKRKSDENDTTNKRSRQK